MTKRLGFALFLLAVAGCTGGPSKLTPPKLNPAKIGEAAIAQYDKDGDQKLSKTELKGCPGLMLANFDTDNDGSISAAEIEERIAAWLENGVGRSPASCVVTFRGQPMPGAKVRLIPEEFFDGAIPAAEGTTEENGSANLATGDGMPGTAPGIYKVQIEHPDVDLAERYNLETTLGMAVDPKDATPPMPVFRLR